MAGRTARCRARASSLNQTRLAILECGGLPPLSRAQASFVARAMAQSPRASHGRGAACESPCRAIHPEIPRCGIEGLRPSLPGRQHFRGVGLRGTALLAVLQGFRSAGVSPALSSLNPYRAFCRGLLQLRRCAKHRHPDAGDFVSCRPKDLSRFLCALRLSSVPSVLNLLTSLTAPEPELDSTPPPRHLDQHAPRFA